MAAQIAEQAELAIAAADAVLFVVDATVGTQDVDEAVVQVLRRSQQAGGAGGQQGRRPAHRGRGRHDVEPRAGGAVRGLGPARAGERRPAGRHPGGRCRRRRARPDAAERRPAAGGDRRQAERRQVESAEQAGPDSSAWWSTTSPAPPSTRSTSWSRSTATIYRFIDTAGIRRRVKEASGHEYYASLRTHGAIERAEVCVVVIDASEPRHRAGPADPDLGRGGRPGPGDRLQQVGPDRRGAPPLPGPGDRAGPGPVRLGVPGQHLGDSPAGTSTGSAGDRGGAGTAGRRGSRPGKLNAFLGRIVAAHPHPVRGGKQPRILFGTQAQVGPPTFVLFTSGRSRPATSASSSVGCARSSASSAPRCTSRCGPGRSASAGVGVQVVRQGQPGLHLIVDLARRR